ncbi:MAG: hypothetical protein RLY93_20230 [Sumerlaeia bacterium]
MANQMEQALISSNSGFLENVFENRLRTTFGQIGWEVGPGLEKDFALSLTFNGHDDLIPYVDAIIYQAPDLPNWEFNSGRPPKRWDGRFEIRQQTGDIIVIDSSQWTYILTSFNQNEFFDVALFGQLINVDEETRERACLIAVQGYLGERETLQWIDQIVFLELPSADDAKRATPLEFLREHIFSLKGVRS